MEINRIFQFLAPKDHKYFPMFQESAGNLKAAGMQLKDLFLSYQKGNQLEIPKKIKDLERKGDEITGKIYDMLNHAFVTPFDREDIHRLAKNLDEVLDHINGVSQKINLYKPEKLPSDFSLLAEIILKSTEEIQEAITHLHEIKSFKNMISPCNRIVELEIQADEIYHKAISDLFQNEKDPIELVKLKDILLNLERTVDRAERVSDILRVVIVKMV